MTDEDKEIYDIIAETRIKVLKERNPDYEEVLEIIEKFSKVKMKPALCLQDQIGKMKCCVNCKFFDGCAGDYLKSGFRGYVDELKQPCNRWELAE